jgi:type IV secretion system protein VirB10
VSEAEDSTPPAHARSPISTRAAPPRPRRLSRRALATIAGISVFGIAGALAYSLRSGPSGEVPQESVSIGRRQSADLLEGAPRDYGDLARQAAADIGPPIAGPAQPVTSEPITPVSPADAEVSAVEQRRQQQRESARASGLFAGGAAVRAAAAAAATAPAPTPAVPGATAPAAANDAQDRREGFVRGGAAAPMVNSGRLRPPAGPFTVSAGATIAAALVTGLSSDLPGDVIAQVTEDVYDSVTGRVLLIPQGARLLGSYDARTTFGQSRALVVWTRLILPDGRSLDLDRMIGTDASGQSGFADRVDHHVDRMIGAGVLSTLFGVGASLATIRGDNSDIASAIRESAGRSVETTGERLVSRQLDVPPTITVRPGARVRVLVRRDLVLAPWPGS